MSKTRQVSANRYLSGALYSLTTLLGVMAFLYPFWLPAFARGDGFGLAHAEDAPLLMTLLVALCFAVLLLEVQGQGMTAKVLALLGILVAMNSVLRFAEAAVPGPGGFSPIFLLIVVGGYVYGARFGFLLGALTILVSGILTGGVGPWMPYQMFVAGWTGMGAVACRPVVRLLKGKGRWVEVLVLAMYGAAWGLIFGVAMNIWFWPFIGGSGGPPSGQTWSPGMSIAEILRNYLVFYAITSLVWDAMRLGGNFLLILLFGMPVLRVLRRFHDRFTYSYVPAALDEGSAQQCGGPVAAPVERQTSVVTG